MGTQYTPHIRRRAGTRLEAGQQLEVDQIYLITAARREDGIRKVAAVKELS